MSDDTITFDVGDVVMTRDDDFGDEWWFNWAGVVRGHLRSGREIQVEFMGFGPADLRIKAVPAGALQHISDHQIGARLNRIAQQTKVPDAKQKAAPKPLKAPRPKVPVELPEDEDETLN